MISDREVKFRKLICTGEEIGIYDHTIRERLDTLRDDRDSIHLAQHLRINNEKGAFTRTDRNLAAQLTEDLRASLQKYAQVNQIA